MSQRATFGLVGAYGATGRLVAAELLKARGEFLIGGRDPAQLDSLGAKLGHEVSAVRLDVLDTRSLDDFCGRCSVLINCGGPVTLLEDRVAQAALRARCHYVDLAGMSIVKERMLPHDAEISKLGLTFAVSAGWMPGFTELLPMYAYARAKSKMDAIDAVSVYFSDSGEWSENALRDAVAYLRAGGLPKPGYFHNGNWHPVKQSEASHKANLGDPIGLRRFSMFAMGEQRDLGQALTGCDFRSYQYLAGFQNVISAMMIALLPLSEQTGVRMMRKVFQRNRLAVGGFVVVRVEGHSQSHRATLDIRLTFERGRDYWTNATVMAATARIIAAGAQAKPGVHFLFDAVDPVAFMAELGKSGMNVVETWEERQ